MPETNNVFAGNTDADTLDREQAELDQLRDKFTLQDGSVDIEALIKKAYNADKHIPKIEGENANLRKELDQRLTYEDLMDKINARQQSTSNQGDNLGEEDNQSGKVLSEADIEKKMDAVFTRKQQEATRLSNTRMAAQELAKVWGQDYVPKLRERARELELSEAYLEQLARDNPKGFLNVVLPKGLDTSVPSYTPPSSSVRSTTSTNSNKKNYAYYQNIRKTDPKKYDMLVREMHEEAHKQGEAFYS